MSEDGRDHFEIPKEMRSMAEAGFDQARKAFESMIASAQHTATTIEGRSPTSSRSRSSAVAVGRHRGSQPRAPMTTDGDGSSRGLHGRACVPTISLNRRELEGFDTSHRSPESSRSAPISIRATA